MSQPILNNEFLKDIIVLDSYIPIKFVPFQYFILKDRIIESISSTSKCRHIPSCSSIIQIIGLWNKIREKYSGAPVVLVL